MCSAVDSAGDNELEDMELTRCFGSAGRMRGFDEVSAKFAAFREFKVRWTRNYRWAEFEVSDYLSDAPERVMRPLADTIYARMFGERVDYPEEVAAWLSDPSFSRRMQPLYVDRYVGLSRTTRGKVWDLADSYERLVDDGLVERDPDVFVGWTVPSRSRDVGHASVLMKVVSMSGSLDSGEVPERVLDYCLFSQLAHVGMGFNPGVGRRGREYDEVLSQFPRRTEMESALRRLGLHVRGRCPRCANTPGHRPTVTPASGR